MKILRAKIKFVLDDGISDPITAEIWKKGDYWYVWIISEKDMESPVSAYGKTITEALSNFQTALSSLFNVSSKLFNLIQ